MLMFQCPNEVQMPFVVPCWAFFANPCGGQWHPAAMDGTWLRVDIKISGFKHVKLVYHRKIEPHFYICFLSRILARMNMTIESPFLEDTCATIHAMTW